MVTPMRPLRRPAKFKQEYSSAVRSANANIADKPFFRLPADRFGDGKANPRILAYAAGCYHPGEVV
jgi:hypothetical protein